MTLTKSQKLRRALKKSGSPSSTAKTTPSRSRSAKKGKTNKIRKNSIIPAAIIKPMPRTGLKGLDSITVEVSQYMTPVTTGIQTTANVLYQCYLNPASLFTSGRLGKFSQLYEKYQWEELEFEYLPSSSTQNSGQVFMAIDLDPEDNLASLSGIGLLNAASSLGSRFSSFPVYGPGKVMARGRSDFSEPLFVDADRDGDRWAYAGRFLIGNVSPFPTSLSVGYVYMRAKIRFMCPALESSSGSSGAYWFMTVRTPSDTYPFGTLGGSDPPVVSSGSNQDITYVNVRPGSTTPGSYVVFGDPGVYLVCYYMTGTSLGTGTVTLSSDVQYATQVPAAISGANPLIAHPNATATYLYAWVSVNKAGGWLGYSQSGTHSGSLNSHFLSIALTSFQLNQAISTLSLTKQVAVLQSKLERMEVAEYAKSLSKIKNPKETVEPEEPGSVYSTSFSSNGVSEQWNSNPVTESVSGTGSTLEEGPPFSRFSEVIKSLSIEDIKALLNEKISQRLYKV